ncbi:MAG: tRNA pseudouridine(38-40) synthase TruA [Bacteroidales bacterium]|nr:tRNA pseudouridine(38-40) synthase TruA [Bacteroidales bacterium]
MGRHRYFVKLAFDGTNFHGWQLQDNAKSVQGVVNQALSECISESINVVGCGRTDAGVGAMKYFAHFDVETPLKEEPSFYRDRTNAILPQDIAVYEIIPVKPEAHARFDAVNRTYRYNISLKKDPFLRRNSWYVFKQPDLKLMNEGALLLKEYSDFKAFTKGIPEGTTKCRIFSANWAQEEHRLIFTITADRFLRNMVRAITGTLLDVGLKKTGIKSFIDIIESRDRKKAGRSVPAHGLFLADVQYPESIFFL